MPIHTILTKVTPFFATLTFTNKCAINSLTKLEEKASTRITSLDVNRQEDLQILLLTSSAFIASKI